MTFAPSQSPTLQAPGHGDVEPLQDALERLLRAADAEAVRIECEAFVHCLLADAQVAWRLDADATPARPGLLELAVDPQNERSLEVTAAAADLATCADMLSWLGRLA
jgi:hypothetical protein